MIPRLITSEGVDTFLFGSKSDFDTLCYKTITELKKENFPFIQRVVYATRSQFVVSEDEREKYEKLLTRIAGKDMGLKAYEKITYPDVMDKSGKASYIERNQLMIDASDFCLFYYDENYSPAVGGNSGTALAYAYATKKHKKIINVFDINTRL